MRPSLLGELEGYLRMKSNEFTVNEGFWDTIKKGVANHVSKNASYYSGVAKGLGYHDLEHTLDQHSTNQLNQRRQTRANDLRAANTQVKPNPDRIARQTPTTPEISGNLQPGERFEIINPKTNTVYNKTSKGWFNALGQQVTDQRSIASLENAAETQRGRFFPAPEQSVQHLSPKQQARREMQVARKAAFQPKPMAKTPVYNKRPMFQGESEMNESVKKAQKLINEYTVKEMAVRRLKKEKLAESSPNFRVLSLPGVLQRKGRPGTGTVVLPSGKRFEYYFDNKDQSFRAGMMKADTLEELVALHSKVVTGK